MRLQVAMIASLTAFAPAMGFADSGVVVEGDTVEILAAQASAPGQWLLDEPDRDVRPIAPLDGEISVFLEPRHTARFAIADPIPALFSYSLELKEPVPTANFTVAVEFLKAIKGFGGPPSQVKLLGASVQPGCPFRYAGVDLCVLRANAAKLFAFEQDARTALANAMAFDYAAVAQSKRELHESAPALLMLRQDLAKVDAEDLRATTQGAPASISLKDLRTQLLAAAAPAFPAQFDALDTATALIPRRADISQAATFALDFIVEYDKTFVKLPLGKRQDYDPANDQPVELTVAANNKFADVFPPGTEDFQRARAGTYKLTVKPRERLSLSIGAGLMYSFVRDPEFSVAEDDAGQLTIAKKEDDYAEFDGAVVLNVTSADLRLFGAHPFVQLGISPSSDNLAILVGAGLQLFDRGAISLGAIYQRVNRLAPGLAEGDVISAPEELVTKTEFKSGLYLMLSVSLK
jgi:hypothetical protein